MQTLKDSNSESSNTPEAFRDDQAHKTKDMDSNLKGNYYDPREDEYLDQIDRLEKDVKKLKKKTKKRIGCKKFSCLGCSTLIILITLIIYIKPPFILNPIKSYINADYSNEIPSYEIKKFNINDNISEESAQIISFKLDENDLINLLDCSGCRMKIDRVELHKEKIILFKNLANKGYPLWLALEISNQNDHFDVKKIGFGKFPLPDSIEKPFKQLILINEADDNSLTKEILNKILGPELSQITKPQNIIFRENEMVITLQSKDLDQSEEIDFQEYIKELIP
ncbi:hypothetical protein GF362_07245 [Candidatus Dojkabacteria bacterium]|nr:hypothetical protein [Candidatus Dojkabacteria bacterium]